MANRTAIAVLAGTSVVLSVLVGLAHGDAIGADAAAAGIATGLATYMSLPPTLKKNTSERAIIYILRPVNIASGQPA
jgi:hypothetical protein